MPSRYVPNTGPWTPAPSSGQRGAINQGVASRASSGALVAQPIAVTDFPLAILSNWHRLARYAHGADISPTMRLRDHWQAQASVRSSGNKSLDVHFPWEIGNQDFSQLYATNPIPTPNTATWGLLNKKFV